MADRCILTALGFDTFEAAVDDVLGARVRGRDGLSATDLWGALANIEWHGPDGECAAYSFRAAGEFVARLRDDGSDYITWYCSGEYGVVAPWIHDAMAAAGWRHEPSRG